MIFSSRSTDAQDGPEDEYFECTYCHTTYDEWTEGCPECYHPLVRVIEIDADVQR